MRLTAFIDFGLRALMRLAGEPDRSFSTGEIAAEFRISRHHLIKVVGELACERTAKNWLSGTRGPAGEHLIELLRNSDGVLEAILRLAKREPSLRLLDLFDARAGLRDMLQKFDELLEPSATGGSPGSAGPN